MDNLNKISLNSRTKAKQVDKVEPKEPDKPVEVLTEPEDDEELNALMNKFKETKKGGK